MRTLSQFLLTFLLNSVWQIALIASLASIAALALKNSVARHRHWIWVASLLMCVGVPLVTSSGILTDTLFRAHPVQAFSGSQPGIPQIALGQSSSFEVSEPAATTDAFILNNALAMGLVLAYLMVVLFSTLRLLRALYLTRRLRLSAVKVLEDEKLLNLIARCSRAIADASRPAKISLSESVPVPITIGIFSPVIIVPKRLLDETNEEVLISAIGHEMVHVQRRDYAFNLAYEVLFLFFSFHPAAALIRRRIRQTRELSCDELVAERILNAEVYARSLVQLASSAPSLHRLSVTTTVGIADADILEVRVMSLLKEQKPNSRWKKSLLVLVSLLLLIPSLAAASLPTKFDVAQSAAGQEQGQKEKEKEQTKERRESKEFQQGWEIGQRESLRIRQAEGDNLAEHRMREEEELKARALKQAALVRLARVPMEQAIQIATSLYPGKVLECSLNGEHWEEPGKLAKEGYVYYHVVVLSMDENEPATNHVLVNALDGTILRSDKELPRKMRRPEQP